MNTNHFASRLHLNEKKQPGCLGDEIGDEILPSSVGILINHYFGSLKNPRRVFFVEMSGFYLSNKAPGLVLLFQLLVSWPKNRSKSASVEM